MNLQVPVVKVKISGYDILQAISQAMEYSDQIGILGFDNLVTGAEKISEKMQNLLPVCIATEMVKSESEVENRVRKLTQQGIKVFIGGNAVINAASAYGCQSVLLESGNEAIIEAIQEAKHLLEVQHEEKEKAEILKSIIDFAYDGILGIDREGKITVFNPVVEKIVRRPADQAIGKAVVDIVENSRMMEVLRTGEAELGEMQHIGEVQILTNRVPIRVDGEIRGVVATFQEIEKIQRMEGQIRKKLYLKGHVAKARFEDIIGKSTAIAQVKDKAKQFAAVDSTILILGETGTGKELFAQSIHNASHRADKLFVAVNCAALPENLLESELFGYVEGAFTGARKGGKAGLFELAHSGTIFLDEISEMSPKLQARFLRVLQEKEVVRIGDDRVIPIDVRVIAASNRNLYELVEKGDFREDLYYRLCVLQLKIPPLRKRVEDIAHLVKFFMEEKSKHLNISVSGISHEALSRLVLYQWPGNVRQLENIIERSVVLCKGAEIGINIITEAMSGIYEAEDSNQLNSPAPLSGGVLKRLEGEMIRKVLEESNGNKILTAEKLGISLTTLWRRLKELEGTSDAKN
jgi:PAS domain S-box-containing protein